MTHINISMLGVLRAGTALSALAILGAATIAMPTIALAQDAQAPTAPVEAAPPSTATVGGTAAGNEEEIIVTGSRIPQPNLTAGAPVTVVSSQDIKLQGTTRVEDMLNALPQVSAGQASGVSNDATGTATVDLRGLGVERTLVLVNGRRLMPGDPNDSAADLNAIPEALVKRVEVLTGGASSTYGADAVAGVVNFILDTDFKGIRVDGQYSFYQHNNNNKIVPPLLDARQAQGFAGYDYPTGSVSDGSQYNISVSIGAGFDDNRGHVVGYFGYRDIKAIAQNQRDYSACTIQNTNATTLQCGGSATSAEGNVLLYDTRITAGTSTFFTFGPNRTLIPGITRFNFAPTNYFQRPDKRYTGGFFAKYEVSDAIKPYLEFMFMDDRTLAQIAPSGNFANTLSINCGDNGNPTANGNPLLSAQQAAQACGRPENLITGFLGNFPLTNQTNPDPAAPPVVFIDPVTGQQYNRGFFQLLRRNVEGGPRVADLQHTQFRGVVGTKGDLGSAWNYDVYYSYGRTNYSQVYRNEFSIARLNRALDVVTGPGGTPVCRSALTGEDTRCVPYDIFGGGVSEGAINYLDATGFQKAVISEKVASAVVTGQLGDYGIKFPSAERGVGVAVGVEYRKESLNLQVDQAFATGDLTGQGGATLPIQGSFNVKEIFGELQVPIIEKGFIDLLTLNTGYRYSKYKVSNGNEYSTDTWKIGIEFAPVKDIRFRGSYNRAARAPNIQELFEPQAVGLDGSEDPCSGFVLTAADVGCLAQGLSVGDRVAPNPAGQYNALLGGNPNLTPEKATTKTLGFVFQPSFVPGFALTVDWYDIKVKNAIQDFGSDAIVGFCAQTADPFACSLVNRNPITGSLWLTTDGFITNLERNIGSVHTRGVDIGASYSRQIGTLGTLGLSFQGSWLDRFRIDNGLSEPYDCVGYYGSICSQGADGVPSGPNAKWKHRARASFNMNNGVGLSLQWRYISAVIVDFRNPSATTAGPFDQFSARLGAQSYFDLAATYRLGDHFNFRLGVNNILDREPPLVSSGRANGTLNQCPTGPCNGNTFPGTYDALGRYIFFGVTVEY